MLFKIWSLNVYEKYLLKNINFEIDQICVWLLVKWYLYRRNYICTMKYTTKREKKKKDKFKFKI